MTGVDDMIAWLREQLDADEQAAQRAGACYPVWTYDRETFTVSNAGWPIAARKDRDGRSPLNDVDGTHIARHDPAHELNVVTAHRRIVDEYAATRRLLALTEGVAEDHKTLRYRQFTVQVLAAGYADRPGYRQEWRP